MAKTLLCVLLFLAASFPVKGTADPDQYGQEQIPLNDNVNYQEACPDYTQYSTYPQ
jgi:hypothetical protein